MVSLKKLILGGVFAAALTAPLVAPSPAQAWWGPYGGWHPGWGWGGWHGGWGWRGGVYVGGPVYAAPVVPYGYAPGYRFIPGHYGPYGGWVPAHWGVY